MPYASSIAVVGIGNPNFTSPLKLFDYLSAGKVIICSDLDILKEVIKEKKMQYLLKILLIFIHGKTKFKNYRASHLNNLSFQKIILD